MTMQTAMEVLLILFVGALALLIIADHSPGGQSRDCLQVEACK